MPVTMDNLPSKFYPFLLGHASCPAPFKAEIDQLFEAPLTPLKGNYVFTAGRWVIKDKRNDGLATTDDSHIYRIRKADKVNRYIHANHLENHIVVPLKFLYWHETEGKFYVICKKLELSQAVALPESAEVEQQFSQVRNGQTEALANPNIPRRILTPEQAKALTEIAFLGCTDLSYNNAYFTSDGRFALLDTEPNKRVWKKAYFSSLVNLLCVDKGVILAQQALCGISKLKLYCQDPIARLEIEKVEKKHVIYQLAKIISKIALITLTGYILINILPHGVLSALPMALLHKCLDRHSFKKYMQPIP